MTLTRNFQAIALAVGMTLGGSLAVNAQNGYPPPGPPGQEYPAPYGGGLRALVDRTQNDLRTAMEMEHNKEKQYQRYNDAQGHLSTFDRKLTHGRFDKGELEKSINSLRDILDHNVLQATSRDALMHDMEDLKIARDRRY